jgi:hypothetical protein
MEEPVARGVNCRLCTHYYITWDERFPYGCRAMGFKSKTTPSRMVFQSSNMPCQMFQRRSRPAGQTTEPD